MLSLRMKRYNVRYTSLVLLTLLLLTVGLPQTTYAQTLLSRDTNRVISGAGNQIFLGVAVLRPLFTEGKDGPNQALRVADALLTSSAISMTLKLIVREKRPDTDERNSFPSGHATAAFAVAAMQSHYHPNEEILWYGGAALIGLSRIELKRHYVHDVLAGMALGIFTARWELSRPRGLVLSPFIKRDKSESGVRLQARF